jgi:type II secretory pathway component PulF
MTGSQTFDNPMFGGARAPSADRGAGTVGSRTASHAEVALAFDDEAAPPPVARKNRVPKNEIADMTAQLAIMTQSGLDLSSALASLAAQCERPALAEVLRDVNELVHGGNTLSEALRLYPEVFDGAYCATVAAAEASGRMAEVLKQLAAMLRSELQLRQSIKGLLTYPILLTAISGSVISILVVFVLPRFAEIFAQYEVALPVVTRMLLGVASELKSRWWLWLPLVGGAAAGGAAWRATDAGRRVVDGWLLEAPGVRNVTRPLFTGRTCSMLGLLLESGVPLLEALRLCRHAASNLVFKDLLGGVADSVLNGRGMATVLSECEYVPLSAREMLGTAERTGNLAEVSLLLGSFYEEEAETRMKQVVRLLEPLITVVMGLVVAVVVLSVMLPIFDLSTVSKG